MALPNKDPLLHCYLVPCLSAQFRCSFRASVVRLEQILNIHNCEMYVLAVYLSLLVDVVTKYLHCFFLLYCSYWFYLLLCYVPFWYLSYAQSTCTWALGQTAIYFASIAMHAKRQKRMCNFELSKMFLLLRRVSVKLHHFLLFHWF